MSTTPEASNPGAHAADAPAGLADALTYPFFQTIFDRKSRRVGLGMEVESEQLRYRSPYVPVPLSELEEALICMAATGLTGLNLGDLDPRTGMSTLVQWTTRSWPSACSNHGTELFFSNDDGMYMLNMFGLLPEPGELASLSGKSVDEQADKVVELYKRAKVQLTPGRAPLPTTLPGLFDFNQWNANKPGTTLFIPVTNITLEYINLLFIYLSRSYRFSLAYFDQEGIIKESDLRRVSARFNGSRKFIDDRLKAADLLECIRFQNVKHAVDRQGGHEIQERQIRQDRVVVYTADYSQNMGLPNFAGEQPGETYYYSPLQAFVFGVVENGFIAGLALF